MKISEIIQETTVIAYHGTGQIIQENILENLPTKIKEIEKRFGVKFEIDFYFNDKSIFILNFDRISGLPGSGVQAMRALCVLADIYKLTINLVAAEGHPKLIKYYLALGFNIIGVSPRNTKKWLKQHEAQWEEDCANDVDLEGIGMIRKPI